MKLNTAMALVVVALLTSALTPAGSAATSSGPDATILGTTGLTASGLASVGVGFCHSIDSALIMSCDGTPGSSFQGAGFYAHDITNCAGASNCRYDVWVRQISGTGNGGFGVSVCTDRDDSGDCTNVGSNFDDFASTRHGDVLVGQPAETQGDYAYVNFCSRPDIAEANSPGYDDLLIFVTSRVDENQLFGESIGYGVGVGMFEIFVDHTATDDSTCTFTGGDDGGDDGIPAALKVPGLRPARERVLDPDYRPAVGSIIIEDLGPGPLITNTFEEDGWDCSTTILDGVHVVCYAPFPGHGLIGWACTVLEVTAVAVDSGSHVKGRTGCYRPNNSGHTVETKDVHGPHTEHKAQSVYTLYTVRIECHANPTEHLGLQAPYKVICVEP